MAEIEGSREREPEAAAGVHYERRMRALESKNAEQGQRRIVLAQEAIPFEQTRQGRTRFFLSPQMEDVSRRSNWVVFEHDIRSHGGRHRHQGGLIIYVVEGEGSTEVDGLKVGWGAGDVLLLPIQPGGAAHQHFNLRPGDPCLFMAFRYEPFDDYAGLLITQLENAPEWLAAAPPVGSWAEVLQRAADPATGEPSGAWEVSPPETFRARAPGDLAGVNLYDWLVALRDWQRAHRRHSSWLIRGDDLPWEVNPIGTMQWYMHPAIGYTATYNFLFYRQRIVPGGRSGRVRHPGEQVARVLSGRGHSLVNGVRHDWRSGDVIALPVLQEGCVYQHCNDGDEDVLLACCEPALATVMDLDRQSSWEVLEPAPEASARA